MNSILQKILEAGQNASTMRAEAEQGFPKASRDFLQGAGEFFVPTTLDEAGLELAMLPMGGPVGSAVRKGGLALASMSYSPEADAGVARYGKGILQYIRENWPRAENLARDALGQTYKTGNEYGVMTAPNRGRLITSDLENAIDIPTGVSKTLMTNPVDESMFMHTHPSGDVSPSGPDVTTPFARRGVEQIITSPKMGSPFSAYKLRKGFTGEDYDDFVGNEIDFIYDNNDDITKFLIQKGMMQPGYDIEEIAPEIAQHTYMRNKGMKDELDYIYNNLGVPDLGNSERSPHRLADILENYWQEFGK